MGKTYEQYVGAFRSNGVDGDGLLHDVNSQTICDLSRINL